MQQSAQPLPVRNRWLDVWIKPRVVIQDVIRIFPGDYAVPITALAGVIIGMSQIGPLGIFFGPIFAFLLVYLYAFILQQVGGWLGGKGTREHLRTAVVWGFYLPMSQGLLVLASFVFTYNILKISTPLVSYVLLALTYVIVIWTLTIYARAIAEAHQFTILKACLTLLLAGIIFGAPIYAIRFL